MLCSGQCEVRWGCNGFGEGTSYLVLVLGKAKGGEPLVDAVLVPIKDVLAVVGDVHGRDNE